MFLGDGLSKDLISLQNCYSMDFDVDVFYKKSTIVSKKDLLTSIDNKYRNLSVKGFRYFPFEKIPVLKYLHCEWINTFLLIFQLPSSKNTILYG